jgi:hypothetical protein
VSMWQRQKIQEMLRTQLKAGLIALVHVYAGGRTSSS